MTMAFQQPATTQRIHRYHVLWIYTLSILCLLIPNHVQSLSNIPTTTNSRPFQLQHLDHIVLTFGEDVTPMMNFYTDILGCTIDSSEDVGRMNGRLTHLRAGPHTLIDLLKREEEEESPTTSSSVDHFCLRIDPYDAKELEEYLESKGVQIQSSGMRKGAEGVGPSIYIQDPEGNTIELKGPAVKPTSNVAEKTVVEKEKEEWTQISEATPSTSKEEKEEEAGSSTTAEDVPVTPCTRICRYNADFFGGQVCIGCYREAYEIGTWASMSPSEKYMGLLDAIDRCNDESSSGLEGAISLEELQRQANYWKKLASNH